MQGFLFTSFTRLAEVNKKSRKASIIVEHKGSIESNISLCFHVREINLDLNSYWDKKKLAMVQLLESSLLTVALGLAESSSNLTTASAIFSAICCK